MIMQTPPVFGIVGHSGSGKTTLIEHLLPEFARRGWRVHVIKHSHHDIELEPPRKDSARFRAAGAGEVIITSPYRFAIMHELHGEPEPSLESLLPRLSPADLVLVEGCKTANIPKLEVWRSATGQALLCRSDPNIIAVASDLRVEGPFAYLPLDQEIMIANYIQDYVTHA